MVVFVSGIALAAVLLALSVWIQVAKKNARKARLRGLELKPNCLLTRYPIAFLSGPRTVFRLFDHWNDVPLYLREHGYEVLVIEPNGRSPEERAAATLSALSANGSKIHLIADGSLEPEMEVIAETGLPLLMSLTVVRNSERPESNSRSGLSVLDLKPRKIALETFEIGAGHSELGFESKTPTLLELSARVLLKCHNFVLRRRSSAQKEVDALETAELGLFQGFRNEAYFLNLAVALAERDFTTAE